jgi:hypothetical protein
MSRIRQYRWVIFYSAVAVMDGALAVSDFVAHRPVIGVLFALLAGWMVADARQAYRRARRANALANALLNELAAALINLRVRR